MTRKTVVQGASLAFVTAVTASFGMTSFVTADAITHTGPHSQNKIKSTLKNKCEIDTENNVDIENENKQKAESGDVSIKNESKQHDDHDKWESESPKNEAQPSSIESADQAEEPSVTVSQATIMSEDQKPSDSAGQSIESTDQPSTKSEGHEDHEEHDKNKNTIVGDITTGDAINSNESKFKVNIETNNECLPIKKAPRVHKPEHKKQPSMRPTVTPSKTTSPTVSGGAGQGQGVGGGQEGGFGAGVAAPRMAQAPTPQPVQHQAPKQEAPCPPEQGNKISNTGPSSSNEISEHVSNSFKATTTNNVSISNSNYQSAKSGDVKISNNGRVGDVSTGDAINENSTYVGVNIETNNSNN